MPISARGVQKLPVLITGTALMRPRAGRRFLIVQPLSRRNYRADKNLKQNPLDGIVSAVKNPSENLALGEFRIPCGQIRLINRLSFPKLRSIERL
jgi:hypothetical protein